MMPSTQPTYNTCACNECGRPVNPNPLTLIPGTLRGYEITTIILDETTDTPSLVRYLKCANCLGPKVTKGIERYEALARLRTMDQASLPPPTI